MTKSMTLEEKRVKTRKGFMYFFIVVIVAFNACSFVVAMKHIVKGK